jgi:glycosyltransferase involved in cell wall biosynthesis
MKPLVCEATGKRTRAIGVVVPVHDEEDLLDQALEAIDHAFSGICGRGIACRSVIVLDDCTDSSAAIAQRWVDALHLRGGEHQGMIVRSRVASVGQARKLGSEALLRVWAATEQRHIWLATTDADSRVPSDWLLTQLHAHEGGADVWTGRILVEDWSSYQQTAVRHWCDAYEKEDAPIHGANLGFNAQVYVDAGGFTPQATGEDRALYHAIVAQGGRTHHDSVVKVVTSARRRARAPRGFSYALASVEDEITADEMIA